MTLPSCLLGSANSYLPELLLHLNAPLPLVLTSAAATTSWKVCDDWTRRLQSVHTRKDTEISVTIAGFSDQLANLWTN